MKKIVILYPSLFNCYSKFFRKISRIIQNLEDFSVVYPADPNGFIDRFFSENQPSISFRNTENWREENITHGIIFDDGEEFQEDAKFLKGKGIPLRQISIQITRVINIKRVTKYKDYKSTPEYEYIGRGGYWGNPYSMHESGDDREEVIRKYKYDFDNDKFPDKEKSKVYDLAGKRLGCFCKPQACHGDILADFLNSWDDKK